MARMHRTQIYLPEEMAAALDRLAHQRGTSRADLLREGARRMLDEQARSASSDDDPLDALVGIFDGGPSNAAAEHDQFLADSERDNWRR